MYPITVDLPRSLILESRTSASSFSQVSMALPTCMHPNTLSACVCTQPNTLSSHVCTHPNALSARARLKN
jgi:hypothetical protein